jgi:hypothetical protein
MAYVNSKQVTEIVLAILTERGYTGPPSGFAIAITTLLICGLIIGLIYTGYLDDKKCKNYVANIGAARKQLISMRTFYKNKLLNDYISVRDGSIIEIMPHEKDQVHLWLLTVMESSMDTYFGGTKLELELLESTRKTELKQLADFYDCQFDKYEKDGNVSKLHTCADTIITCYYAT